MIGDDNSDCFKGTWNTDFSVKTVTRATGSIASPISACDLVFFAQNNLQNDSSTGVYYSNGKIGVISAVTNNFKPSIDKPIPTLVYYNYRNFSNPSYYYWYQNRSVLTNLSVLNGTYNFTFDFDYLGKHYSIKKRMIISYQFTNTVKTSVSTFSANLNNSIQLVNIYTIKGSNVAECHVFDIVDVWKLLYILNISVKSNNIEKAYITAALTAEGDDEFIFKLNNSYNMSLPSNAGSCMTCSACGNYTNFYKNSTKTFDVTQYLQDTNSIYVYFHNFTGGYSYKISNLEFTIKTYSKLQFTNSISPSVNSLGTLNKTLKVVLKHVFSKSVANVNTEPVNCGLGCYWEYDVISIKIDLPDEVSNYSKIDSFFKLYGMADNDFKFYLNNSLLKTVESICPSMCHIQSNWSPSNYNFSFPVTSKNNTLLIKAYSDQMIYWAKIYSASVSIETTSKQFTDTIKVLCNNASKQILISKPFTAPTSTSERCRQYGYYYGIPIEDFVGSSGAASQTKTFTASDFLYPEHIKKYEVKFACGNGTCVFKINGEIKYQKTLCSTCPDRSSGITVSMPVTISSSSSLNSGFAQSAFRVCAFYQVYKYRKTII